MTGTTLVVLPAALLGGGAFVVYLVARFISRNNRLLASITSAIFLAALAAVLLLRPLVGTARLPVWGHLDAGGAFLRADPGAVLIAGLALGLGLLVAIYSGRYLSLDQRYETYYPLLLLLVTGLVGMVLAADLFNLYLFCELMSVAAYVLVAFRRRTTTAIEAGFKYLIMGSVGTVTMLLGISFVYRDVGQLAFPLTTAPGAWTRIGTACLLVGLALKSAIVPLHTWLPDAHSRTPSSISAMLSGIVVQSVFYTLLKVSLGLGLPPRNLGTLLIGAAMLNLVLGNGMALVQIHTKRLLAYSTIAQMGIVMLGVGIGLRQGTPSPIQAGMFVITVQAVMKGLAFLSKGACHYYRNATRIDELRGTAAQQPLVAATFGVALAGLAGVPPLAGFAGKWLVLREGLGAGDALALAGVVVLLLNSLLALGYYLPLIAMLFTPAQGDEQTNPGRIHLSAWMGVPLVLLAALVLVLGVYPGPALAWTAEAGTYLLSIGANW